MEESNGQVGGATAPAKVYQDAPVASDHLAGLYENPHLKIQFQNGAVQEVGDVNGTCLETVIGICRDRIEYFQTSHMAGKFACPENAAAQAALNSALAALEARTARRLEQGVEGKNETHNS